MLSFLHLLYRIKLYCWGTHVVAQVSEVGTFIQADCSNKHFFFINERNILEMYALPYNNIATCGKASRALKSARNRDSTCETIDNLRCVGLLDESCIVYFR